jgi:copper chaperone CopZ
LIPSSRIDNIGDRKQTNEVPMTNEQCVDELIEAVKGLEALTEYPPYLQRALIHAIDEKGETLEEKERAVLARMRPTRKLLK